MPVIQGGRWQRYLQKYFGIKGEVVASEMAPEIYAVYSVNEPELEQRFLEGWRSYFRGIQVTSAAGNVAEVILDNVSPIATPVISVVERMIVQVSSAAADVLRLAVNGAVGGAPVQGVPRDTRMGVAQTGSSVMRLSTSTPVGAGDGVEIGRLPGESFNGAQDIYRVVQGPRDEFSVLPSETRVFSSTGLALTMTVMCWWRERLLESSEITA